MAVTAHVTQHTTNRASAIDDRTTRHRGYALSQRIRMRIEEIFGWLKTIGLLRKTRHRGTARVEWMFLFSLAAYAAFRSTIHGGFREEIGPGYLAQHLVQRAMSFPFFLATSVWQATGGVVLSRIGGVRIVLQRCQSGRGPVNEDAL